MQKTKNLKFFITICDDKNAERLVSNMILYILYKKFNCLSTEFLSYYKKDKLNNEAMILSEKYLTIKIMKELYGIEVTNDNEDDFYRGIDNTIIKKENLLQNHLNEFVITYDSNDIYLPNHLIKIGTLTDITHDAIKIINKDIFINSIIYHINNFSSMNLRYVVVNDIKTVEDADKIISNCPSCYGECVIIGNKEFNIKTHNVFKISSNTNLNTLFYSLYKHLTTIV